MSIDILDGLRVAEATIWPDEPKDVRRFADGSQIQASVGAMLWRGSVTLAPAPHAVARAAEARIAAAKRSGQTILIGDPRVKGPATDPDGSALGAAEVRLWNRSNDGLTIRLSGLPTSYTFSAGDLVAFDYGDNPVRRALHRLTAGANVFASGRSNTLPVVPPVRPGVAEGSPTDTEADGALVTLIAPKCRALITDWRPGRARREKTEGITFSWVQTLR